LNKDKLFAILNDWNYWFKPLKKTYSRNFYEEKLKKLSQAKEIIVLKGVRRSGKSTLLLNEQKRLLKTLNPKNILFVNLEDMRFNEFDKTTLLEDIKNVYLEYIAPKGDIVLMLDEIQNIPLWEKWVLKEYELTNNQIYITGSNSHLLSSEFSTALSGRYLSLDVYPLSFKEFLEFKGIKISSKAEYINQKIHIAHLFREYMQFGGFPKITLLEDEELKKELLGSYYDTILLKDIVARYKLKNYNLLNELATFLLINNSTINALNKLKNNFNVSFDLIKDYVEYLTNAYMIFTINKFDFSYKKQIANPKKFYSIDTGLSNRFSFSKNQGSNLENIVFLELKRRYKEIYYYKTNNNLECDFYVKDANLAIQVSVTLDDEKTLKRELRVFKELQKELKNITPLLITMDETQKYQYEDMTILAINVIEWILDFETYIKFCV